MKKTLTINISEEQINALNSVLIDALDYYSTLKNNAEELKKLQNANMLSNYITRSYYNADNLQNKPNSFQVPIKMLSLSSSTKKMLADMSIIIVGDLISYTRKGLLKIRYMKSKSVDEIEDILSGMGLKLAVEDEKLS